ncbi:MAG: glycosyltransferase 61 family protein, partial [Nitrospiraceae bacterium]
LGEVLERLGKSGMPTEPPQVTRDRSLQADGAPGADLGENAEALSLQTVGLHQQLRNIGRDARIRHARRLHPLRIVVGDPMVTIHSGGIIVRGKALRTSKSPPLLYRGGAYTRGQEIIAHSCTTRTAEARCIVGDAPDMPPRPRRNVSKRVIYGGFVFEHFGHLLLEGLARLWGARLIDNKLPIYVQCAGPTLSQVARKLLELAGLAKQVHVVGRDTSFDSVVVPEPAFVVQYKAHKAFKEMYLRITDRVLGSSPVDTTDQPLYLSRTGLPPDVRSLFGESILEDVLRRNGVHIVHPERLDLAEQIYLINRHRVVLGPIGTAFHLLLFSRLANEATYFCTDSPNLSYGLCDVLNGTRAEYVCVAARRPPFHHGRFKRAAAYPEILNIDACLAHLRDRGYITNLEYDRQQLGPLQDEHRRRFLHAALRDAQLHRNRTLLDATAEVVRRDYRNDATLVGRLETVVEVLNDRNRLK